MAVCTNNIQLAHKISILSKQILCLLCNEYNNSTEDCICSNEYNNSTSDCVVFYIAAIHQFDEDENIGEETIKSPFGSSFRTFDITDYSNIGKNELHGLAISTQHTE